MIKRNQDIERKALQQMLQSEKEQLSKLLKNDGFTPHSGTTKGRPKNKKRYENSFSSEEEGEEDEALKMAMKLSKQ